MEFVRVPTLHVTGQGKTLGRGKSGWNRNIGFLRCVWSIALLLRCKRVWAGKAWKCRQNDE